MSRRDVKAKPLDGWDSYREKRPEETLASVYAHIEATSLEMRSWYWTSIRMKRRTSLAARLIAFSLLVLGTTLPIFAAIQEEWRDKLLFTQWGVALLAIAGLTQVADKVFGWSSGWMRYITTVVTMENLTRAFQMEWANYLVAKTAPLDISDAKALFDLARGLEQELMKLQAEETTRWVAEFNSGISLMDTLIKTQREETDRKLEAIRTGLAAQETSLRAEERSRQPGAIELTFKHVGAPVRLNLALDAEAPSDFVGQIWSRLDVPAGSHVVRIATTGEPISVIEKVVVVRPGEVTRDQISL